jgi:nitric oxide reductase NorQ protein
VSRTTDSSTGYRIFNVEEYASFDEPYYEPVGDEEDLFRAAFEQKIPVLLKGPTGCGKTRFVEHMAYQLGRPHRGRRCRSLRCE